MNNNDADDKDDKDDEDAATTLGARWDRKVVFGDLGARWDRKVVWDASEKYDDSVARSKLLALLSNALNSCTLHKC